MSATITCRQTLAITSHRILASDLNEHETVYGGELLSLLDGTTSIAATRFARTQCVTAAVDNVNFLAPFTLNDSLCIEAYVTGAGKRSIEVFAKVIGEHLTTGERFLGMTAFFTFVSLDKATKLPQLEAQTPEEKTLCQSYPARKQLRDELRKLHQPIQARLSLEFPWQN